MQKKSEKSSKNLHKQLFFSNFAAQLRLFVKKCLKR